MLRYIPIFLFFLLFSVPCAAEEIFLFKDYYYGMKPGELLAKSKAEPCLEAELDGHLCVYEPISFMGEEWMQIFMFSEGRLTQVLLGTEFSDDTEFKVTQNIKENNFLLLHGTSSEKQFDGFNYLYKGQAKYEQALVEWITSTVHLSEKVLSFFDKESILFAKKRAKITNLALFIQNAPINTRCVELQERDDLLFLSFLAPIKALHDLRKSSKKHKEAF